MTAAIITAVLLAVAARVFLAYYELPEPRKFRDILRGSTALNVWGSVTLAVLLAVAITPRVMYDAAALPLIKAVTLTAVLCVAAYTDKRKGLIPNKLILAGLTLRVAVWAAEFIMYGSGILEVVTNDLLGCVVGLAFLIISFIAFKNGIGMGDVKLLFLMGLFQGLTNVLGSVFWALVAGFILSVTLLITRKKNRRDSIPFAPALLLGAVAYILISGC